MSKENEDHIILKDAESSAFIELSFDGHIYAGWFYSNSRANGRSLPATAVERLLCGKAYRQGVNTLSATQFCAALKRLSITLR